jgi:hypothetical protein
MKVFPAFVLLFFLQASLFAQNQTASFPKDFIGVWKGKLDWYRAGDTAARKIDMELHILPSKDTAGQYTWRLVYGKPGEDNRPYILKQADTTGTHWVIDELNGIVLDQYWIGNRFYGSFTVQNTTIVNCYYLEKENLIAEFISWPAKPVATTGKGNEDAPFVDSYNIRSLQRAVLKRQ